jgi:hypothetical protein
VSDQFISSRNSWAIEGHPVHAFNLLLANAVTRPLGTFKILVEFGHYWCGDGFVWAAKLNPRSFHIDILIYFSSLQFIAVELRRNQAVVIYLGPGADNGDVQSSPTRFFPRHGDMLRQNVV